MQIDKIFMLEEKKLHPHSSTFSFKTLSLELRIVFLTSWPKNLDKVIEINSWEMIPTSTHSAKDFLIIVVEKPSEESLYDPHEEKKSQNGRCSSRNKYSHLHGKNAQRHFHTNLNVKILIWTKDELFGLPKNLQ